MKENVTSVTVCKHNVFHFQVIILGGDDSTKRMYNYCMQVRMYSCISWLDYTLQ